MLKVHKAKVSLSFDFTKAISERVEEYKSDGLEMTEDDIADEMGRWLLQEVEVMGFEEFKNSLDITIEGE